MQLCQDGDCLRWAGAHDEKGYGLITIQGVTKKAHRWAYLRFVGPVRAELELDHLCRVRDCVNVFHLEPVTHGENIRRGDHHKRRVTHCPKGHEYTPENTYISKQPARVCRTCNLLKSHRRNLWKQWLPRIQRDVIPYLRTGGPL